MFIGRSEAVTNSANMICKCEWTRSKSHSECFLASSTRRVAVAKRSQVQDVRQQKCFWLISKTALISLPEAGAGRFPVSLGQWRMFFVFIRQLMWSAYPFGLGIPLVRTSERERYERMTGAVEKKKNRGWICPSFPLAQACSPDTTCDCHAVNQAVI